MHNETYYKSYASVTSYSKNTLLRLVHFNKRACPHTRRQLMREPGLMYSDIERVTSNCSVRSRCHEADWLFADRL